MRLSTAFFLLLTSVSAIAGEKANQWLCEVRDPSWPWPKKSQVEISLKEPIVRRIDWIQDDNGNYEEHRENLITSTTVSKWKTDKSKCVIRSGFNHGEFVDGYDFSFSCKGIEGSFSMDFRYMTGFYSERLTSFGAKRNFSLENCSPSK